MTTKIKFCGLHRKEDIVFANETQPDYVGFVFAKSTRHVTAEQVKKLTENLDPEIQRIGVFVNEPMELLLEKANTAGLTGIQLHGDESPDYVRKVRDLWNGLLWRAVRIQYPSDIRRAERLPIDMLVLDAYKAGTYGGTGTHADLSILRAHRPIQPFFLAGGLNAENICACVEQTEPYGVDISSGIETDGIKDMQKMKQISQLIRGTIA